jgi:hypothetical protein
MLSLNAFQRLNGLCFASELISKTRSRTLTVSLVVTPHKYPIQKMIALPHKIETVGSLFSMLSLLLASVISIPKRYPGLVWGPEDSQVGIEIFCDPLCPDCRATWPIVLVVLGLYPTSVNVRFLPVNLPYHTWSFYSVWALSALNSTDLAKQTINAFYLEGDQDQFNNAALQNVPEANIPNEFATYFQTKFGVDPNVFLASFNDPNVKAVAQGSYGWAAGHAVDGTPTVFINGAVTDLGPDSGLNDWTVIIDGLLK